MLNTFFSENVLAGFAIVSGLALMIAIPLLRYSEYRDRRARYDGFKGHSLPMKILMIFIGILAIPALLFYMYLRITPG
ncbi:MAG: hypothetical protein JJ866_14130 [Roseibium sp.]|uniref:hypothetical protein n=1 Tax=Roseibium sp. TaxID=1936156 RepID=UPI001B214AEB|nr:hypothetical protein [Roseibium sp.]MBO6893076.1 hypothetical protein [Roseibium sp.]MBO6929941.1 hypothetical protein [Roseibium sp.]